MATRVSMKFFKVSADKIPSNNETTTKDFANLTYLVNLGTKNTVRKSTDNGERLIIDIYRDNIPSIWYRTPDLNSIIRSILPQDVPYMTMNVLVDNDRLGLRYILINTNRLYIDNLAAIVKEGSSEVFEFHVNPQRVSTSIKKLSTEIRTRAGWEVQHWGNDLEELRVEGITGSMHKKTGGVSLELGESVVNSVAWQKLVSLKNLFYSDKNSFNSSQDEKLLALNYYDDLYVGYFKSFEGPTADAQQPYIINYSFTFKILNKISLNGSISFN